MSTHKQPKSKTNNEKLIIGVIIGAVIGFLIYWSLDIVTIYSKTIFTILIVIAVCIAILLLLLTWFRHKIIKRVFGKDIEFSTVMTDTQEAIHVLSENVTENLPIENEKKQKLQWFVPKIINYILWSNFRNWGLRIFTSFVLGLGGIVTTILIINQNKLFELQNMRVEQQTHLIEADRRSAQVFIMGEVLSDVHKELADSTNIKRTLSSALTGRIMSLSMAMKPYRYMDGDSLIQKPLSPERSQLFASLLLSKLDTAYLFNNVFKRAVFKYADFQNVEGFIGEDLSYADLEYANFKKTRLNKVVFKKTNLQYADFEGAFLGETNFAEAKLYKADLSKGRIGRKTNFQEALMMKANLTGLTFEGVHLEGANISEAILTDVKFKAPYYLDSLKIGRYHWISYIKDSLKLEGAEAIAKLYYVDSVVRFKGSGKLPMLLRKKM